VGSSPTASAPLKHCTKTRQRITARNHLGAWSNRKTPVLQTGNSGAIPDAVHFLFFEYASVEKSGVLATLSRWRSWVQIPSGALQCFFPLEHPWQLPKNLASGGRRPTGSSVPRDRFKSVTSHPVIIHTARSSTVRADSL
jgi:hypothetical protein